MYHTYNICIIIRLYDIQNHYRWNTANRMYPESLPEGTLWSPPQIQVNCPVGRSSGLVNELEKKHAVRGIDIAKWKEKSFHQDLGWLSCLRSPTFRHLYIVTRGFTGLYGQCCLSLSDTLCHRCFLLLDRMRLLSPVSRTQWLLCADPPFFCAPLMTWLRNGSLVSDALFLGGLICFRICLINSFHCFGQWTWMNVSVFVSFHERELSFSRCCSWTEGRTARDKYPSSWQPKKKMPSKKKREKLSFCVPTWQG